MLPSFGFFLRTRERVCVVPLSRPLSLPLSLPHGFLLAPSILPFVTPLLPHCLLRHRLKSKLLPLLRSGCQPGLLFDHQLEELFLPPSHLLLLALPLSLAGCVLFLRPFLLPPCFCSLSPDRALYFQ
jgi:hypothetical protein